MKTIQTKSSKLFLVKVPKDAYNFKIVFDDSVKYYSEDNSLSDGNDGLANYKRLICSVDYENFKIMGKFSELEDKDFEEFVKKMPFSFSDRWLDYSPYLYSPNHFKTATESFQSLCKSQGIEDDLSNYLIIKKV
jgi:hypothetical protein